MGISVLLRSWLVTAGITGVAASIWLFSPPAKAMDFAVRAVSLGKNCGQNCPLVMVAGGAMDAGTASTFQAFAQGAAAAGARNVLVIDSLGGVLEESIKLGVILRAAHTTVFVGRVTQRNGALMPIGGSCLSACVYSLMGGQTRFAFAGSHVGVHRESLPNSTGSDRMSVMRSQQRFPQISAMLRRYARSMGVSPALVDLAEQYAPDGLRMLTPVELLRFRLAKIAH